LDSEHAFLVLSDAVSITYFVGEVKLSRTAGSPIAEFFHRLFVKGALAFILQSFWAKGGGMNRFQNSPRIHAGAAFAVAIFIGLFGCNGKETARIERTINPCMQSRAVLKGNKGVHFDVAPVLNLSDSMKPAATSLQITIENRGQELLVIRYEYFALNGDNGEEFVALPLFNLQKTDPASAAPQAMRDYGPVTDTRFEQTGFSVASYYASLYPGLPGAPDIFFFNEDYFKAYGGSLGNSDLPKNVYQWVIPEGVLRGGGSLKGILLFEPVDPKLRSVVFRASLVNGDGRMFGYISIPFCMR
jgi:hypothetical protein